MIWKITVQKTADRDLNKDREEMSSKIQEMTKDTFLPGYDVSEAERFGIVISKHFEWDGVRIMEAFRSALEDANFHEEAAMVEKWIKDYES